MKKLLLIFIVLCYGAISIQSETGALKSAPNFAMNRTNDERMVLYQEMDKMKEGELMVINFTESICKPCKVEIPKMMEFRKSLGVNTSKMHYWIVFVGDDKKTAHETASTLSVSSDIPVLYDPMRGSTSRFRFNEFPATYVLKKNGEIVYREFGYTTEKFWKLVEFIKANIK